MKSDLFVERAENCRLFFVFVFFYCITHGFCFVLKTKTKTKQNTTQIIPGSSILVSFISRVTWLLFHQLGLAKIRTTVCWTLPCYSQHTWLGAGRKECPRGMKGVAQSSKISEGRRTVSFLTPCQGTEYISEHNILIREHLPVPGNWRVPPLQPHSFTNVSQRW